MHPEAGKSSRATGKTLGSFCAERDVELLLLLYSRLGDTGFHQGLSKDTYTSRKSFNFQV